MNPSPEHLPMQGDPNAGVIAGAAGAGADAAARVASGAGAGTLAHELWELTKPRLSLLSVITAVVGYLAAQPARDLPLFLALVVGTSLAAGGAAALNMWLEREADGRMARTRHRPLPAGNLGARTALVYGLGLCLGGDLLLWSQVNGTAAALALVTQVSYLLVYTPLKQVTRWNTEIGAIPGAIPPLIGWAAAESGEWALGWILFAILLTWQIPHFMAIAWIYREDYARGGFKMLTVVDPTGDRAARQSFVFALALLGCSLLPAFLGLTSPFYAVPAALAGLWFLVKAARFLRREDRSRSAKALFLASVIYLPVLLAALVVDRWLLT